MPASPAKPALLEQLTVTDRKVEMVSLDLLKGQKPCQLRAETDAATIARYAEAYLAGATMPPVVIFHEDDPDLEMWHLADGHHRVAAARKARLTEINAIIKKGTNRDAILYAAGANGQHGLPLTNADKHRIVSRLLEDDEWVQWGDREIARHVHCSPNFVGKLRKASSRAQPEKRIGKDGVARKTPAKKPKAPKASTAAEADAVVQEIIARIAEIEMDRPAGKWNDRGVCTQPCSVGLYAHGKQRLALKIGYHKPSLLWHTSIDAEIQGSLGFSGLPSTSFNGHTDLRRAVGFALRSLLHRRDLEKFDHTAVLIAEGLYAYFPAPDDTPKAKPAPEPEPTDDQADDDQADDQPDPAPAPKPQPRVETPPHKQDPPAPSGSLEARRQDHLRELVRDQLTKGKPVFVGAAYDLLALALIVGVNPGQRQPTWDLACRNACDDMADEIRQGLIDSMTAYPVRDHLPPLQILCELWSIDYDTQRIIAERAITE